MRSEGYSSRSVCLSVCAHSILGLQATRRLIIDTNSFSATRERKKCGDFAKTAAFGRYGVKFYSRTTGYETAYERCQQLQCYKRKKNNVAILLKPLRSGDMA